MTTHRPYQAPKTFEEFMRRVDACVAHATGLSALDLPDYCYRDAFDAGEHPGYVARAAIRAAHES